MICNNCGKEVEDGLQYCPECSAPLEEPVILSKDQIKTKKVRYTNALGQTPEEAAAAAEDRRLIGPFIDIPGYVKKLSSRPDYILALVGAMLVYLSPFIRWIYSSVLEKKGNLFEIGMNGSKLPLDSKIEALGIKWAIPAAILVLIGAFFMLCLSASAEIKPLRKFEGNIVVKLIPWIILAVILFLLFKNESYATACRTHGEFARNSAGARGGRGEGFYMYLIGLITYAISIPMARRHER